MTTQAKLCPRSISTHEIAYSQAKSNTHNQNPIIKFVHTQAKSYQQNPTLTSKTSHVENFCTKNRAHTTHNQNPSCKITHIQAKSRTHNQNLKCRNFLQSKSHTQRTSKILVVKSTTHKQNASRTHKQNPNIKISHTQQVKSHT